MELVSVNLIKDVRAADGLVTINTHGAWIGAKSKHSFASTLSQAQVDDVWDRAVREGRKNIISWMDLEGELPTVK